MQIVINWNKLDCDGSKAIFSQGIIVGTKVYLQKHPEKQQIFACVWNGGSRTRIRPIFTHPNWNRPISLRKKKSLRN
jgi:hypothetical protein